MRGQVDPVDSASWVEFLVMPLEVKLILLMVFWNPASTSWHGKYPIIFVRVLYIPGGAGFLPSTVVIWWKYYAIFIFEALIHMQWCNINWPSNGSPAKAQAERKQFLLKLLAQARELSRVEPSFTLGFEVDSGGWWMSAFLSAPRNVKRCRQLKHCSNTIERIQGDTMTEYIQWVDYGLVIVCL